MQQRVENEAVRDELALDEGANVFKTVGPVLFRQDYDEVKENVEKRLEFIAKEVQKVDDQVRISKPPHGIDAWSDLKAHGLGIHGAVIESC